jgi:hypothetical protein
MVTAEERMRILQMLQEGKISPEAAAQLLEAMGEGATDEGPAKAQAARQEAARQETRSPLPRQEPMQEPLEPGKKARWLRVRVTDSGSGRPKVNVRMPISLVNLGLKIGARYTPEIEGLDLSGLLEAAQMGEAGPFVDVYDDEDGEHVEVFLE